MRALPLTGVTIQGIYVGTKRTLADLLELISEGKVSNIYITDSIGATVKGVNCYSLQVDNSSMGMKLY